MFLRGMEDLERAAIKITLTVVLMLTIAAIFHLALTRMPTKHVV
jgi:hypothetical protein